MITDFSSSMTFGADISNTDIDFEDILGIRYAVPSTFTLYTIKEVQCRKHRKKRINKKWAKRYGFRTVTEKLCDVKDIKVNGENDDGLTTYTITGEL